MSMLEETQTWDIAIAAMAKFKNPPENFMICKFSWIGDVTSRENCIMEVTGAVFREAKTGPRKGKRCIMVKGTERRTFLTPAEIDELNKVREE